MAVTVNRKKSPDARLLDVLIALSPLAVWSFVLYGTKALGLEIAGVLAAAAAHLAVSFFKKYALKKERRIFDLSPVITGLLISFTLPAGAPVWIPALGSFIAIAVKEAFGGMGKNPVNPALTGRVFLELVFGKYLTVVPVIAPDIDRSAIGSILENELPDVEIKNMFLGLMDGGLGETSALLILVSALFLILRGTVKIETPVAMIASAAAVSMIFAPDNVSYFRFTGAELLAGGLLLCSVFFVSDPVTTPQMFFGRLIFGALAGALAILCRLYIGYEGIYVIVFVLGLWTPLLDRLTRPSVFGGLKVPKAPENIGKETAPSVNTEADRPETLLSDESEKGENK